MVSEAMIDYLLQKEKIPEFLIRHEIRRRLAKKLHEEYGLSPEERLKKKLAFIEEMKKGPIALHTKRANEQHYEVPATFFKCVLGGQMKYSSGWWEKDRATLDDSEEDMLALTVDRAQIKDGQKILELGCGWGSLALYMARRFPNAEITAVSNSKSQREYILYQAQRRKHTNIEVITADMNDFEIDDEFDRAVSVEMFEHMRNYQKLLEKISGFLVAKGKLFVHVFAHRELCYPYVEIDPQDWIAQYFFTGGLMPSADIFDYFQDHFRVEKRWEVPGTHYRKTCRAWLDQMDESRVAVKVILAETYTPAQMNKWWSYWRIFFMACEELFGYKRGTEWLVSHTLLEKK